MNRAVVGGLASLSAAALAVTWVFVVPDKADQTGPAQSFVLRHAHPACWGLLAIAAAAWACRAPRALVGWPARGALACYLAFLAAMVL